MQQKSKFEIKLSKMLKQKKSYFLNKVNGLTIKVNYTRYN